MRTSLSRLQDQLDDCRHYAHTVEIDGRWLVDRDVEAAGRDGYPASSLGGGNTSRGVGDPTGEVAALNADIGRPADMVRDAKRAVLRLVAEARGALQAAAGICASEGRPATIVSLAEHKSSRSQAEGECQACGRHVWGTARDRLRSFYCLACFVAWGRAGRPERPGFERARRAAAEEPAA